MTRFASEALGKHDRSTFNSGSERIDRYFRETVSQDIKRNYAAWELNHKPPKFPLADLMITQLAA